MISTGQAQRETWLPFLTLAVIVFSILMLKAVPVQAQPKHEYKFDAAKLTWREYRRDDLGFRVEVPGEPMILVDESLDKQSKTTEADVMFDRVTFGVTVWEFRGSGPRGVRDAIDRVAGAFQVTYGIEPRTNRFAMGSAPAREDIFEFKDSIIQHRIVGYRGRVIQLSFSRKLPDDDITVAGGRFLNSFTLLPAQ